MSPRSEPAENATTPRMSAAPARSAIHRPRPGRNRASSFRNTTTRGRKNAICATRDPQSPAIQPARSEIQPSRNPATPNPIAAAIAHGSPGRWIRDPVPELPEVRRDERHADDRDRGADQREAGGTLVQDHDRERHAHDGVARSDRRHDRDGPELQRLVVREVRERGRRAVQDDEPDIGAERRHRRPGGDQHDRHEHRGQQLAAHHGADRADPTPGERAEEVGQPPAQGGGQTEDHAGGRIRRRRGTGRRARRSPP